MTSPTSKNISNFGNSVHLCDVVEYYGKNGLSWKKSREKVFKMLLVEKKRPDFIGFERTSEIFVSRYKDDSWRDKKCKRNWIMYQDS